MSFLTSSFKGHPLLANHILEFGEKFSLCIEEKFWPPSWPPKLIQSFLKVPRLQRHLSKVLQEALQLPKFDYRLLEEPKHRWIILPPKTIRSLLDHITAIFYSSALTKLLSAQDIKAWKTLLGPQLYDFALKKAPLYRRYLPEALAESVSRENEAFTQKSVFYLKTLAQPLPDALRQHLFYRFSIDSSEPLAPENEPLGEQVTAQLRHLMALLLQKEFPQEFSLYSLCFS